MKIPPLPFTVTDWSTVAPTVHPGETGEAIWRTFTIGDLRVRQVEYTPGYLADHWPDRVAGLVSITGYNIQNIATELQPASPEAEYRYWYQWYFHTERGRAPCPPIVGLSVANFGSCGRQTTASTMPTTSERPNPSAIPILSKSRSTLTDTATGRRSVTPNSNTSRPNLRDSR
jgi:hypothetical protein